jgi:hypothetical protein
VKRGVVAVIVTVGGGVAVRVMGGRGGGVGFESMSMCTKAKLFFFKER